MFVCVCACVLCVRVAVCVHLSLIDFVEVELSVVEWLDEGLHDGWRSPMTESLRIVLHTHTHTNMHTHETHQYVP